MLLFSQGCLDLDVSKNKTIINQKLGQYFPDDNNATDKASIFDCMAECFTQGDYFIYYISLLIIVVIWIRFHESSMRIVIYIIVMWIPFNKTSVRIIKSIIVLWTLIHETSVGMVMSRRVWRYQRGNQNPYIEEEQTIQWPKGKVQKINYDLQNIHIKLKVE
jgi:hypothetical protein